MAYSPNKKANSPNKRTTLGERNARIMQEAKRRASNQMAFNTESKVRKSMGNPKGATTFSKVSTGRLLEQSNDKGTNSSLRKSQPGSLGRTSMLRDRRTSSFGPNLMTANRSSRKLSVASYQSGLLSDVNSSNVIVSPSTEQIFDKTIDYSAKKGNACDERLAELIKQFNIKHSGSDTLISLRLKLFIGQMLISWPVLCMMFIYYNVCTLKK